MTKAVSFVVWDRDDEPSAQAERLVHWRRFDQRESVSSVPRYLEEHADRFKQKYLAFIHDLGEYRVSGKKSRGSSRCGRRVQLLVDDSAGGEEPVQISANLRLSAAAGAGGDSACGSSGNFDARRVPMKRWFRRYRACAGTWAFGFARNGRVEGRGRRTALRAVHDALPSWLRGLLSLRHTLRRWPLRRVGVPRWYSAANDCFICSYFIHLDRERCEQGSFHSRHWEGLPKFLHDEGRNINWIQLFLVSEVVPDLETRNSLGGRLQSGCGQPRAAHILGELSDAAAGGTSHCACGFG